LGDYKTFPVAMSKELNIHLKIEAAKSGDPLYVWITTAILEKLEREGNPFISKKGER
jgi:hypothetical protein